MRRLLLALLILVFLFAGKAEKPVVIPGLGETVEVSIINVDVIVTDAKGHRVRGLSKDDFQILENGKPQPISNFAEYSDAPSEPAAGAAHVTAQERVISPPHEKRTVVLFLEPFRTVGFRVSPYINALKNVVRKTVRRGDSVTVIEYETAAKVAVPSTDDVAQIEHAIDDFGKRCTGLYNDPTRDVVREAKEAKDFDNAAASAAAAKGFRYAAAENSDAGRIAARLYSMKALLDMRRRVAAIDSAIESMAAAKGRKMLILSSHRLGRFVGAEFYYAIGEAFLPPDARADFDNSAEINRIAENANAAGVTLYPLYPAGLDERSADPEAPDVTRPVLANEMLALDELAERTGGISGWGASDIAKMLPQIADDASQYYSLAYRVSSRHDDAVRKVVVRPKNAAFRVRARSEYVEKSDDRRMRDRVIAALNASTPPADFEISASVGGIRNSSGKEIVPLTITIPTSGLTPVPNESKYVGAFSVYVASGTDDGLTSDITRQTQKFEISQADLARMQTSHFTYDLELVVNRAASHVGVGVIDEVSKSFGVVQLLIRR
jgi:VWFA-related protein